MPTPLAQAKKSAFDIANQLDDAADAIRDRSRQAYAAGKMSLDEYTDARIKEMELRAEASVVAAVNLGAALDAAAQAGQNIEQAIADAKARIETVKTFRKGLEIVAALVVLAGALASGNAKAVVKAGKGVADLV
ncbi:MULTISPECIES: hypothetical protein [Lysobacter]|uniref:Uncharacterized protein n=1 Tax=Lysobacter yananisis TaxID=1003114 RepID=A0ABY9PDA6_9GAMM|nr:MULTISPECIES: hypothetical protein [Lysobacter]QQQ00541.1 hypothetical protein JHW41_21050 [Lysobacter enzymogenes]UZW59983.1 hypothetical protein BV903_022365 [Lysobacter enzymogenes]WMT03822.1 hypothetical protein RDV84_02975 [Lysobacter yananisis]